MPDGTGSATQQTNDAGAALAAAALAGNAGTPAAPNGDGGADKGSSADAPADPFAGLETGTREWLGKKGVKDVATLAKTAFNAESLLGKSVQLPDANAPAEEWNKFFGRVGRPEKPDGYEFKLPGGLPEDMPYDADFAKEFRAWSHEAGLTPKQAALVHDKFVERAGGFYKGQSEAAAKQLTVATEALEAKYGKSDSDTFKAAVDDAFRAVKGLGIEDDLKASGLLGTLDGKTVVTNPKIAIALAEIGAKLYREDGLVQGNSASANNPFADGPDKGNATVQNLLWKQDPVKAEALIRAAGHTPEQFGYRRANAA